MTQDKINTVKSLTTNTAKSVEYLRDNKFMPTRDANKVIKACNEILNATDDEIDNIVQKNLGVVAINYDVLYNPANSDIISELARMMSK